MFTVVITEKGGAQRRMDFEKPEVTIGRVQGNDIILPKGNVSKRHSRIVLKDKRFIVVDLKSTNGTYVNGRKITSPLVVKPGDKIYIGDFIMAVEGEGLEQSDHGAAEADAAPAPAEAASPSTPQPAPAASAPAEAAPMAAEPMHVSSPVTDPPPPAPSAQPSAPSAQPPPLNPSVGDGGQGPSYVPPPVGGLPPGGQRTAPAPKLTSPAEAAAPSGGAATVPPAGFPPAQSDEAALRMLMARLGSVFDVANVDPHALRSQDRWNQAQATIQDCIGALDGSLGTADRDQLGQAALREAVGLGPLEELLANDQVREVVVEGSQRILVDRGDGLETEAASFSSNFSAMVVAQRLIAQGENHIPSDSPIQHTALPYGPHVTVVLPPVAVRGPVIEVRRMGSGRTLDGLTEKGVIDASVAELLRAAISSRKNVLVAGPVDAGVTELVGALASCLDEDTRVATVESSPDLVVSGPQVLSLSSGEPGTGLSLSDVADEASQMRVDWLVVDDARRGDVRGIFETVRCRQPGNIVGLRAAPGQRPEDTLHAQLRLNGENESALRDLFFDAVDVVVQMDRDANGAARAVRIAELTGPSESLDLIVYDGSHQATGAQASFK